MRKCILLFEFVYVSLWLVVIFIIMPRVCQDLSFSIYYKQNRYIYQNLAHANDKRADEASTFLKTHDNKFLFDCMNITKMKFCFTIITAKRPKAPCYLTQTVARLVKQLQHIRSYTFVVYNAGGFEHTEAIELSKIVPVITNTTKMNGAYSRSDRYQKEKVDYSSALKWCLTKDAEYNIIIEDDAIADNNFISKLQFILNYCLSDKTGKSWVFMKLFYPEKFQGWGNHPSSIVELILAVSLFSVVIILLSALILPGPLGIDLNPFKIHIKYTFYWRVLVTTVAVLYIILFGRAHWEELRKLSPLMTSVVDARGCCTPAVLYPQMHFKELIQYLDSIQCSSSLPLDIALDQFVKEKRLRKFLVIPNLFTHIGMISSLPKGFKSASEFGLLFPP